VGSPHLADRGRAMVAVSSEVMTVLSQHPEDGGSIDLSETLVFYHNTTQRNKALKVEHHYFLKNCKTSFVGMLMSRDSPVSIASTLLVGRSGF
jgi:hypothetical protein